MKGIDVDPKARTVRAGRPGSRGASSMPDTSARPRGDGRSRHRYRYRRPRVGSGSGWLERKFGFVCDNLFQAEVVTADGRVVNVSEHENADLF